MRVLVLQNGSPFYSHRRQRTLVVVQAITFVACLGFTFEVCACALHTHTCVQDGIHATRMLIDRHDSGIHYGGAIVLASIVDVAVKVTNWVAITVVAS
jgi:hypothetical protein